MGALVNDNNNLPALVSRAGQRLLDARNSAELLEAKKIAEAALHYAKVTKAANDTHADCLRIITRAEIRMADEIDRGQASGEVATRQSTLRQGPDVRSPDNGTATYEDMGLSRQRVAEWRETRDAGEEVVETAIQSALAEGRAPTKADIQKHVRGTFGTGENEWYTPTDILDLAREFMGGFDLDPASSLQAQQVVKAARYFTKETDGLAKEWAGRVWLNPPYSQPLIAQFVEKLVSEVRGGAVTEAILLTHNYTDTRWFQGAASEASAICFPAGRIRFVDSNGALASPTQGQALTYFGKREGEFVAAFHHLGLVVEVR